MMGNLIQDSVFIKEIKSEVHEAEMRHPKEEIEVRLLSNGEYSIGFWVEEYDTSIADMWEEIFYGNWKHIQAPH